VINKSNKRETKTTSKRKEWQKKVSSERHKQQMRDRNKK
jgi:hypothetical protein